jgi:hypothetical protein
VIWSGKCRPWGRESCLCVLNFRRDMQTPEVFTGRVQSCGPTWNPDSIWSAGSEFDFEVVMFFERPVYPRR